jgi:hypothetical protein
MILLLFYSGSNDIGAHALYGHTSRRLLYYYQLERGGGGGETLKMDFLVVWFWF